jgi:hypothetical protein
LAAVRKRHSDIAPDDALLAELLGGLGCDVCGQSAALGVVEGVEVVEPGRPPFVAVRGVDGDPAALGEMDRTLTQLDMASCLAQDGDPSSAMKYALDTLTALTEQQRRGIITIRGHELVVALPQQEKSALPARDFHDLLMATTDAENQGARR